MGRSKELFIRLEEEARREVPSWIVEKEIKKKVKKSKDLVDISKKKAP